MPALRRRRAEPAVTLAEPAVPWALGPLLRRGPEPTVPRAARGDRLDVALVLGPAERTAAEAGIPEELLAALPEAGLDLRVVREEDIEEAADADVVLAAGWPAAPAVLMLPGVRARAVLATAAEAPFAERGWTTGVPVLGPPWLGAGVAAGADAAYRPLPVHRRDDLVLVHGEDAFGMLAVQELLTRRDDLTIAVTGTRRDLALPFPFLGTEPGAEGLAYAFASATAGLAPAVRGWRPAATAMLACGLAVVAPDTEAGRDALGDAAALAGDPIAAADAVEAILGDLALRADRARAGAERIPLGWEASAGSLAAALRALA